MIKSLITFGIASVLLFSSNLKAQEKKEGEKPPFQNPSTFSAFQFRNLGPALVSGRIGDIAVNPNNYTEYYLAVAAGSVWKTSNAGTTYQPVFDGEGSYSIGCVAIDPSNTNVVWVGTGENNNQRSVGYGDGVYKSEDGGKSWKNVGLKNSEHIGKIAIDPTNGDVVYVAAYGPLWSAGGERGIYKTTDGGKTWKQVLQVSEHTGFNEVHIDPNHPNIIYATAHQRRRSEWTYISGGPESAIYKSTDGGITWNKLTNGLPTGDIGRIGLAVSPANTDVIYAIIEAEGNSKGFYCSTDRGASWEKRSSWSTAGNYYQEIVAHPKDVNTVYSLDTWAKISTDGGRNFKGLGEKHKHVDNHALWINPHNTNHYLMGCDGGLYESFDAAQTWQFKPNLPVTQFYRVSVDNSKPFYYVYGGTQDNNSLGGPSRTISATGITNQDWFITVGGDGFESQIDPEDPNIVYSQWQYGGLIRYDRRTGETVDIKPQEKEGEAAYRWNWDAPLIISNFSNKRLYFAANKVFRTDDRGQSWKIISPDLSRGIDRNKLPVMGKVWSMDAVAKNQSTTIYGNVTALAESPKNEKLLYAGTDDGLIHVTENGGDSWRKISSFANVPDQVLVQNITPSQHNENLVYACFNNHRSGDFKPYLLKSSDKGKTWVNISNNLPVRGSVYILAEDHKNPNLLFVGTEFGLFFTLDGGNNWMQMKSGLPTTCVRDIAIQKRENDLVIATFGRGFYVLDDYSPLQNLKKEDLEKNAYIAPIKDGLIFIPSVPLGHKGKSFQGESFYTAENPPIGATITCWIKNDYKTIKDRRQEKEKQLIKNNQPVYYPSVDSIRAEDREEAPFVVLQISDEKGNIIRKIKTDAKRGLKRITWDGRMNKTSAVSFYSPDPDDPYASDDNGPMALPGKYTATLVLVKDGKTEKLGDAREFNIITLNSHTIPVEDVNALKEFYTNLSEFRRIVSGTSEFTSEMQNRVRYIKHGLMQSDGNTLELLKETKEIETKLNNIDLALNGDRSMARREFETLPGISGLIEGMVGGLFATTTTQPKTYEETLIMAKRKFGFVYGEVKATKILLESLEKKLDKLAVPYTPGRLPEYNGN